jgi:hypothetical protein
VSQVASGLGLVAQATVRICDVNGDRLGQGLCVPLEARTILVLTCHHVVSKVSDRSAIPLMLFSSDDQELQSIRASYCMERSDPHHDIAVLTIVNESIDVLPPKLVPLSTDFPVPANVVGIIRPKGRSQRFNAQLVHATPLSVQIDSSTVTIPRAWRLIYTNDVRPGISGSPIVFDDGVIGLTYASRAETTEYSREGYVVPIESWFDKNPEIAAFSKPYEPQGNQKGGMFAGLPSRNPFFTGRDALLEEIRAALREQHRIAVSGLGGIGKTQVALEYAYRHGHEYKAIFWVGAENESAVSAGFVDIARLLDLPQRDAQDQSEAVGAAKRWLESHPGWLLIVDNADEPNVLRSVLPGGSNGRVLLTSRAQVLDMLWISKPIEIRELPPDEALEFLLKRTGGQDAEPLERASAQTLASELGYLPLALEQAAAYIVAKTSRVSAYLNAYRKRRFELLARGAPVDDPTKSVMTTWRLAFDRLEETPSASDLLRASAFVSPDRIPLELIAYGAEQLGPAIARELPDGTDELALDELLAPLTRYSLIRREPASSTYSLHRLVQEVTRDAMDAETRRTWAKRVVAAVNAAFPDQVDRNWTQCERLLPHARAAARFVKTDKERVESLLPIANRLASSKSGAGRYYASSILPTFAAQEKVKPKVLYDAAFNAGSSELRTALAEAFVDVDFSGLTAEATRELAEATREFLNACHPDHDELPIETLAAVFSEHVNNVPRESDAALIITFVADVFPDLRELVAPFRMVRQLKSHFKFLVRFCQMIIVTCSERPRILIKLRDVLSSRFRIVLNILMGQQTGNAILDWIPGKQIFFRKLFERSIYAAWEDGISCGGVNDTFFVEDHGIVQRELFHDYVPYMCAVHNRDFAMLSLADGSHFLELSLRMLNYRKYSLAGFAACLSISIAVRDDRAAVRKIVSTLMNDGTEAGRFVASNILEVYCEIDRQFAREALAIVEEMLPRLADDIPYLLLCAAGIVETNVEANWGYLVPSLDRAFAYLTERGDAAQMVTFGRELRCMSFLSGDQVGSKLIGYVLGADYLGQESAWRSAALEICAGMLARDHNKLLRLFGQHQISDKTYREVEALRTQEVLDQQRTFGARARWSNFIVRALAFDTKLSYFLVKHIFCTIALCNGVSDWATQMGTFMIEGVRAYTAKDDDPQKYARLSVEDIYASTTIRPKPGGGKRYVPRRKAVATNGSGPQKSGRGPNPKSAPRTVTR